MQCDEQFWGIQRIMPPRTGTGSRSSNTAATGSFELAVVEHPSAPIAGGYNPYDTFPSGRRTGSSRQHADLRQLSEWIRLKRQVEQAKKTEGS
jgi:hypothetical protein